MTISIATVTDSTADLTTAQIADLGVTVVPLNVHFGQSSWRDRLDLSADEFLAKLASSSKLPTTSQPSVGTFEAVFRDLADTHDAIVCLVLSSRFSGTYQSAMLAAEAVADLIDVRVVDSMHVSASLGMQVMRSVELVRQGHTVEEVVATLQTEIDLYQVAFFVETLDHLQRGGRIGKAAMVLGTALKLKPLLRIEEGQIVPFERTRTRAKAAAALIDFAQECGELQAATVLYNTTADDAVNLARELAVATNLASVPTVQVAPVISAHVGPGILGVAVKEVSHD